MACALVFTDDYTRRALRFLKRHPELKNQYAKTLALLEINPHHPSLRLHALRDGCKVFTRCPSTCHTASPWN